MLEKCLVSFDFWDTSFVHKNPSQIAEKDKCRIELLSEVLCITSEMARQELKRKFVIIDNEEIINLSAKDRLTYMQKKYNREFDIDRLIKDISDVRIEDIQPVDGVVEALKECNVKAVSICNTKWTKGEDLRRVINCYGLCKFFDSSYFSDDCCYVKPQIEAFQKAWSAGCNLNDTIHIGDGLHTDIKGANNIGAKSVLCRVVKKERTLDDKKASAVMYSYKGLSGILQLLQNNKLKGDSWKLIGKGDPHGEVDIVSGLIGSSKGNIVVGDWQAVVECPLIFGAFISSEDVKNKDKAQGIPIIDKFKGDLNSLSSGVVLIDFSKGEVYVKTI